MQKLLGFTSDVQLLTVLKCSSELRNYCGFTKVPDPSQITRFKQNYCEHIQEMFEHLVDVTDPICRRISEKKADYLIYDTTGIEPYVAENNPKFMTTKLRQAKRMAKNTPDFNPYRGVYGLLPESSGTNADAKQQYINGHYCYLLFDFTHPGIGYFRVEPSVAEYYAEEESVFYTDTYGIQL